MWNSRETDDDRRKRMRNEAAEQKKQLELAARPALDPKLDCFEPPEPIDFDHYLAAPRLKLYEMFRLLFGMSPENTSFEIGTHPLWLRLNTAKRAGILPSPLRLETMTDWALQENYPLSPSTLEKVQLYKRDRQKRIKVTLDQKPKAMDARRVKSIQLILGAIARQKLSYDPSQPRSKVPSDIEHLLALEGKSLKRETIKSILNQCIELLDEEQD
jgi:hypothetical protein